MRNSIPEPARRSSGKMKRNSTGKSNQKRKRLRTITKTNPIFSMRRIYLARQLRCMNRGPRVGYIFPVAGMQGYLNLKGYGEFDNDNRPDGWNVWLTFVLSPAPPSSTSTPPPIIT